jgi:DNA-binding IclR family transcriptional regulator
VNGKAFLAEMPVEQIKRLVPEVLQVFISRTITKREQLLEELKRVHLERIAYDREEHTEGICAVGTVVRDVKGNPAAVTIPVPSIRFYGNEQLLSSALLRTRERIAQRFDALMNFDNRIG